MESLNNKTFFFLLLAEIFSFNMGKLVSLPMNDRKTFVYSQRVCAWDVLNIHHMAAINISNIYSC